MRVVTRVLCKGRSGVSAPPSAATSPHAATSRSRLAGMRQSGRRGSGETRSRHGQPPPGRDRHRPGSLPGHARVATATARVTPGSRPGRSPSGHGRHGWGHPRPRAQMDANPPGGAVTLPYAAGSGQSLAGVCDGRKRSGKVRVGGRVSGGHRSGLFRAPGLHRLRATAPRVRLARSPESSVRWSGSGGARGRWRLRRETGEGRRAAATTSATGARCG